MKLEHIKVWKLPQNDTLNADGMRFLRLLTEQIALEGNFDVEVTDVVCLAILNLFQREGIPNEEIFQRAQKALGLTLQ